MRKFLQAMTTEKLQGHFHNWAVTTENFNSYHSLTDLFSIVAVDDASPQGLTEDQFRSLKEFVTIVEAKKHPIQAWQTHPECIKTRIY